MANKKEEISNEIAKKLVNMLYIVIILLVVNLAISISNVTRTNDFIDKNSTTDNNKDNNDSDTIPEYDVSKYKAINYSEFSKAKKAKGYQVIYIGRSSCGYCAKFIPVMNQVQSDYGFTHLYFDITQLFDFAKNKVTDENIVNLLKFAFGKLLNKITSFKFIVNGDEFIGNTNQILESLSNLILVGFSERQVSTYYISELQGNFTKVKNISEDSNNFLKRCVIELVETNIAIDEKDKFSCKCDFDIKIYKNDIGENSKILEGAKQINNHVINKNNTANDNKFIKCINKIYLNKDNQLFGVSADKSSIRYKINISKAGFLSRL